MGLFDLVKKAAWKTVTSVFKQAHFHWQNLNERTDGEGRVIDVGWPFHGRCWFMPFGFGDPPTPLDDVEVRLEWNLGQRTHIGASLRFDHDHEHQVSLGVGLPPLSVFITLTNVIPKTSLPKEAREIGVRVIDDTIVVDIWSNPWCWSSEDRYLVDTDRLKIPRSVSFVPVDLVFGERIQRERVVRRAEVEIPMPEGAYPALVELIEVVWRRPRLPYVHRVMRANVKPLKGIPVPGKGENSWDCGDNAILDASHPASSIDDGIAAMVKSVLKTRTRYGGRGWKPTPVATAAPGTEEDLPDPPGSEVLAPDD